ncbi:MAG: thermonuclease family protein [Acidobacteria bacterium]|nr:thermonuclease family protein [Acidobacteriota bacterium]
MQRSLSLVVASFVIFAAAVAASAQASLRGTVTDVIDGRTVVVELSNAPVQVTLQYIETPVAGTPMGETVKLHLKNLLLGKTVDYRPGTLQFGQSTGRLMIGDVDVSEQMLRDGAAWHLPAHLSGQSADQWAEYSSFEAAAKGEKRGIWAQAALKPSWQSPASANSNSVQVASTRPTRPKGKYGDVNPNLGDVGALYNGYNAETRTGYIGTSPLGASNERGYDPGYDTGMDVMYFYRENEGNGRTGFFVITVFFRSANGNVAKDPTLTLTGAGKDIRLSSPKKFDYHLNDRVYEVLQYHVERSVIEKIVNNDSAYLHIGQGRIQFYWARYLLYNLLQLSR